MKKRLLTTMAVAGAGILVSSSPAFAEWKHAGAFGCGSSYVMTLSDNAGPLPTGTFSREHSTVRSGIKTARYRGTAGSWTTWHTQTGDSRDWYAINGWITGASSRCA